MPLRRRKTALLQTKSDPALQESSGFDLGGHRRARKAGPVAKPSGLLIEGGPESGSLVVKVEQPDAGRPDVVKYQCRQQGLFSFST